MSVVSSDDITGFLTKYDIVKQAKTASVKVDVSEPAKKEPEVKPTEVQPVTKEASIDNSGIDSLYQQADSFYSEEDKSIMKVASLAKAITLLEHEKVIENLVESVKDTKEANAVTEALDYAGYLGANAASGIHHGIETVGKKIGVGAISHAVHHPESPLAEKSYSAGVSMLHHPATTGYGAGLAGLGGAVLGAKALKSLAAKILRQRAVEEVAEHAAVNPAADTTATEYLKKVKNHVKKVLSSGVQLAKDNPLATAGIAAGAAAVPLTAYALNKSSSVREKAQHFLNSVFNDCYNELLPNTIAEFESKYSGK